LSGLVALTYRIARGDQMPEENIAEDLFLIFDRDGFELKCHADGFVEIFTESGELMQITAEEFDLIVKKRNMLRM